MPKGRTLALLIFLSVLLFAGIGWLAPYIAVVAFAGVLVGLATAVIPEFVLAGVVLLGLAGGDYASLSSAAYILGMLAGFVSLYALLPIRQSYAQVHVMLLPASVVLLISLRFALENNFDLFEVSLRCISIVLLTYYTVYRKRDVVKGMAVASVVFGIVSLSSGETDDIGSRLIGISGNSNRMVFGALVLLPFLLQYARRRHPLWIQAVCAISIAANVYVVIESGSSQGLAGLAILFFGVLFAVSQRWPYGLRVVLGIGALVSVFFTLTSVNPQQDVSQDVRTLSGRTELYEAAWNDFLGSPLYGTGERHVTDALVFERSAHSSMLGLLAAGGLIVGLPWLLILVRVIFVGMRHLQRSNMLGLSFLIFVVEQFVQSVEFVLLTWFVIAFAFLSSSIFMSERSADIKVELKGKKSRLKGPDHRLWT